MQTLQWRWPRDCSWGLRRYAGQAASCLFKKDNTTRALLLAHLENQELITLSACLRPHQACPVASRVFIYFPCASEPAQIRGLQSCPHLYPHLWEEASGQWWHGQRRTAVAWPNIPLHIGAFKSKNKPNPTNHFSKSQTESTSQSHLYLGQRGEEDPEGPFRFPCKREEEIVPIFP